MPPPLSPLTSQIVLNKKSHIALVTQDLLDVFTAPVLCKIYLRSHRLCDAFSCSFTRRKLPSVPGSNKYTTTGSAIHILTRTPTIASEEPLAATAVHQGKDEVMRDEQKDRSESTVLEMKQENHTTSLILAQLLAARAAKRNSPVLESGGAREESVVVGGGSQEG